MNNCKFYSIASGEDISNNYREKWQINKKLKIRCYKKNEVKDESFVMAILE